MTIEKEKKALHEIYNHFGTKTYLQQTCAALSRKWGVQVNYSNIRIS